MSTDALKRTLLDADMDGRISLSGSSGIVVGIRGSDAGTSIDAVSEVSSPASLVASLTGALAEVLRLRFTTLVFFFRPDFECLPEPRPSPVVAEWRLTRDGLDGSWSLSRLPESEKVYVVAVPRKECDLARLGVDSGELKPVSVRSMGPAQALKTAFWMPGVNNDSVRWELASAAKRSMFFWENSD